MGTFTATIAIADPQRQPWREAPMIPVCVLSWRLFVARPLALALLLLLVGATVLVGPSLVAAVRGRRALPAASSTVGGC